MLTKPADKNTSKPLSGDEAVDKEEDKSKEDEGGWSRGEGQSHTKDEELRINCLQYISQLQKVQYNCMI